jgi:hypothetical protein
MKDRESGSSVVEKPADIPEWAWQGYVEGAFGRGAMELMKDYKNMESYQIDTSLHFIETELIPGKVEKFSILQSLQDLERELKQAQERRIEIDIRNLDKRIQTIKDAVK